MPCGWKKVSRLRSEHKVRIGDERILGDSEFVQQVLKHDEITIERRSLLARKEWTLEKLVKTACEQLNIREAELLKKSRANDISRAKAVISYTASEILGIKTREIAERLKISQPAVSKWIVKGRELAEADAIPIKLD